MAMLTLDRKGRIVLPSNLRRKWGLERGGDLEIEEREDGALIRPMIPTDVPGASAEGLLKELNADAKRRGLDTMTDEEIVDFVRNTRAKLP